MESVPSGADLIELNAELTRSTRAFGRDPAGTFAALTGTDFQAIERSSRMFLLLWLNNHSGTFVAAITGPLEYPHGTFEISEW